MPQYPTLTKEQAYHAYETYSNAVGTPTSSFEYFGDNGEVEAWQKVANVFWSFTAIPDAVQSEAA